MHAAREGGKTRRGRPPGGGPLTPSRARASIPAPMAAARFARPAPMAVEPFPGAGVDDTSSMLCRMRVNGQAVTFAAHPGLTLLEALRRELALTGSKQGCDKGDCGACTVLLDGEPVLACLTLALACEGREVVTVEGLAEGGRPSPLQDAFDRLGAAQCGFCTPGMLVSATALLARNSAPTESDVREALSGNLCRCTGYGKIVAAVLEAARMPRERA